MHGTYICKRYALHIRREGALLREFETIGSIVDPNLETFSAVAFVTHNKEVSKTVSVQVYDSVAVRIRNDTLAPT